MQDTGSSSDDLKTVSAWDALRARRAPHPPNPLRYSHTFWFVIAVIVLAITLTVSVVPASTVESDMLVEARQAKLDGFPDLPPGDATAEQISDWREEWNLFFPNSPGNEEITELSLKVGDYQDESSLLNLGVMGSLAALVFLSAIAFGRALNNLYALGYGASVLSPAWAFISWLLPILSFILPWRVVTEVVQCAWTKPGQGANSTPRWPQYLAALWGVAFAGLWLLNPISVNIFIGRGDIDEWINHIEWTHRMMLWIPIPAFFTAAMLALVAIRQHSRYRELDRLATATQSSR